MATSFHWDLLYQIIEWKFDYEVRAEYKTYDVEERPERLADVSLWTANLVASLICCIHRFIRIYIDV